MKRITYHASTKRTSCGHMPKVIIKSRGKYLHTFIPASNGGYSERKQALEHANEMVNEAQATGVLPEL